MLLICGGRMPTLLSRILGDKKRNTRHDKHHEPLGEKHWNVCRLTPFLLEKPTLWMECAAFSLVVQTGWRNTELHVGEKHGIQGTR